MAKSTLHLKKLSSSQCRIIGLWLLMIVAYLAYLGLTDESLSILVLSGITNLLLLPLYWTNFKQEEMNNRVSNPVEHFRIENNLVTIGDSKLPVEKVKRVAIDVQDKVAYCSLPFNHIKPGIFPNFTFASEQADELKRHIGLKLPSATIIE
ncbi:MAG: hypothetical protein ABJJ44_02020 [Paraglaciecola sp.]|uniref:hypothetical protein n=2 Tax=Paraglaciecola sp. TaxID=1920173 RepID=UPI003298A2CA